MTTSLKCSTLTVLIVPAYQDESPEEVEIEKTRKRFKDVEAQKIRDDVTIQVRFNVIQQSLFDQYQLH